MKVLAAMSGGVDSAVAAARAVEAGHEVVGVHLALSRMPGTLRTGSRGCCIIPGDISVVTEPRTGLSVQVRENYDVVKGMLQRTYALIYGVKAGEPASLVRINGS